jgi:type IV secretory pathway VirJ component
MTRTLQAKMLAELIGTFALIFIGAGAAAILGEGLHKRCFMMRGFEWSRAGLALALLLGCALPFSPSDAAAVPSVIETGTRLGDVRLFESAETPKELLFLFSDREGWNDQMGAAAANMAAHDVAVVGVDLKRYLQALGESGDQDCHYLDSDIEQLSKQLQSKVGIAQYRWPILAGIGAGGVLAYGAAAQAPDATIAGALVADPARSLETRLPLCSGAPASRFASGGFSYGPMPDTPGWLRVADLHQPSSMPWVEQITGAERVTVPARSDAASALVAMLLPMIGFAMPTGQGLDDLPLAEVPAAQSPVALAVILSGDGGWRDIDKQIGQILAEGDIGVVGLDSLRYFWSARTPEQLGRDLDRIVAHYQAAWGVRDVLLIGYSFGADVLPASYNHMSPATQSAVVEISLLGLAETASFEFHVSDWLGLINSDALPIAPEIAKLDTAKVQCFYGEEEDDSLCRNPVLAGAELIETKGGHHFDGDYQALARRIIEGYERRGQA